MSCLPFQVLIKINELLDMMIAHPDLVIGEHITEESESLETAPLLVRGCALTIVERMDEEFIKLLKVSIFYFFYLVCIEYIHYLGCIANGKQEHILHIY